MPKYSKKKQKKKNHNSKKYKYNAKRYKNKKKTFRKKPFNLRKSTLKYKGGVGPATQATASQPTDQLGPQFAASARDDDFTTIDLAAPQARSQSSTESDDIGLFGPQSASAIQRRGGLFDAARPLRPSTTTLQPQASTGLEAPGGDDTDDEEGVGLFGSRLGSRRPNFSRNLSDPLTPPARDLLQPEGEQIIQLNIAVPPGTALISGRAPAENGLVAVPTTLRNVVNSTRDAVLGAFQ